MTRHGSLAYYLAAWVCGSLFFAAAKEFNQRNAFGVRLGVTVQSLLTSYFFTLILGVFVMLLFALQLRVLARMFRWQRAWQWALIGFVLTILFSALTRTFPAPGPLDIMSWYKFCQELFALGGEHGVPLLPGREFDALRTILAGMLTAFILFRVDRAFSPREDLSSKENTSR